MFTVSVSYFLFLCFYALYIQVNDLRKELESRALSSKGLKSQLIARLTKQLKVEEQKEEQKELEKSEKEEEEEDDRKSEDDKEVYTKSLKCAIKYISLQGVLGICVCILLLRYNLQNSKIQPFQ